MERNEKLEAIADKIRSGIPVPFDEAYMAAQYAIERNAYLKREEANRKANVWWRRLLRAVSPKRTSESVKR